MACVDALVKTKATSGEQAEHPKYKSFCHLIEDFKSGEPTSPVPNKKTFNQLSSFPWLGNMPEDDLVMESNHQEVTKCPITGKPIVEPIKNSRCDHVYEKAAIIAYTKAKSQKK